MICPILEVITIAVVNYRRCYGYTQQDFANLIGKDRKTYCLKEKGRINFSPREMLLIRDELRKFDKSLTIDQIFFTSKMDKMSKSN